PSLRSRLRRTRQQALSEPADLSIRQESPGEVPLSLYPIGGGMRNGRRTRSAVAVCQREGRSSFAAKARRERKREKRRRWRTSPPAPPRSGEGSRQGSAAGTAP